jgi:hypothetical protein
MQKVIIKSCPSCTAQLEEGYLSFGTFLKWFENKPSIWHGLGGTLLAGDKMGHFYRSTRALKCSACHLVMFLPELHQD